MASKSNKKDKRARYKSYSFTDRHGKLYARVQIKLPDGRYKTYKKRAMNLTHAAQLADEMFREYGERGQGFIDSRSMRLQDLAEWYKKTFVVAPVYKDGKKVAGMRTWEAERRKIDRIFGIPPLDNDGKPMPDFKPVQPFIPNVLIGEADEDLLLRYKLVRLKTVGIAAVNRDLETVRAMMRKAKKKKWLKEVPDFSDLHDKSLEDRRTVTITEAQEKKILAEARAYTYAPRLFALILALRDSGARPNELYPVNDYSDSKTLYEPLRWRDIMVDGEIVDVTRVVSYKGKKRETRLCVITERMKKAFEELWNYLSDPKRGRRLLEESRALPDNMIFPQTSFQSAWEAVREKAGVPELRLRDLRRDWSTRLARLGYSDRLAQRGMGHASMQMTFEYTEFDMDAALSAKAILDRDNTRPIDRTEIVN